MREGFRALVFAAMVACLAVMLFAATRPQDRNASRWYVSRALGLSRLQDVTSPADVFAAVMDIATSSRQLFPLSSRYMDDPLAKVRSRRRAIVNSPCALTFVSVLTARGSTCSSVLCLSYFAPARVPAYKVPDYPAAGARLLFVRLATRIDSA